MTFRGEEDELVAAYSPPGKSIRVDNRKFTVASLPQQSLPQQSLPQRSERAFGVVSGQDLRAARQSAKVSLDALAEQIGMSKGHLSRVERGQREVTPALLRSYQQALGVHVAATNTESFLPDIMEDMKRRSVLGIIAAASVGSASLEPLARLLDGLDGKDLASVGVAEAQAVEAAADLYTRMDLAHGGSMAAAMARGSLSWAIELLDRPMTPPVRERLSSAIGLLADRLGWAIYDAGDTAKAGRVLTLALDNAARGTDRDLGAHVMLDLSTVVTDAGRPSEGVEILRLALGDERISSAERANLHAVAARHCAAAHDRPAGLRHVDLAEEALTRAQPASSPGWARRITVSPDTMTAPWAWPCSLSMRTSERGSVCRRPWPGWRPAGPAPGCAAVPGWPSCTCAPETGNTANARHAGPYRTPPVSDPGA